MIFHLAQLNIARWAIPEDHPLVGEFEAELDTVNAVADAAPGFIWRLQDDSGNATGFQFLDDPRLIVNLSVWETWEQLKAFTYQGTHREVFRRRSEWFAPATEAMLVMWWVPAGHRPDLVESADRLLHLRQHGPSESAFTPGHRFAPPEAG